MGNNVENSGAQGRENMGNWIRVAGGAATLGSAISGNINIAFDVVVLSTLVYSGFEFYRLKRDTEKK